MSRDLCKVKHELIKEITKIPVSENQNSIPLNEENVIVVYHQMIHKSRVKYLLKLIKLGQEITHKSLPYPTSIFNLKLLSIITILSQVLGLENDWFVNEVILGFFGHNVFNRRQLSPLISVC